MTGKHEPRVAVFGASGHTGRFVVDELLRRRLTPIAIGRSGARLASFAARGIAVRTAAIEDSAALDRAFADAAAVINCAGPFLDTAAAIAAAALRAGAHYLDVTAEQASARATLDSFDAPARAAGVAVLPAMGFYGGFADLLATAAAAGWDRLDDIRIGIALDFWHPTPGTRATGARNTAPRVAVSAGRLAPPPPQAAVTSWTFDAPFGRQSVAEVPLSEIVLIARHIAARELHTYLTEAPLRDLSDAATPPPLAVDAAGRSAQIFQVDVIARRAGETRRIVAQGRDIYAFTAPLVCEAAGRLLNGAPVAGAHAPGAIFDAAAFLTALAADSAAERRIVLRSSPCQPAAAR